MMEGDKLARGARSATFSVAPGLKFNEGEMHDDLKKLSPELFMVKYMITQIEYDMLKSGDEERVNTFAQDMKSRLDSVNRALAADELQDLSLRRDCFLTPFVPIGLMGRVIADRDVPAKKRSTIALPKSMRTEKTLLPTTGHIIKAVVFEGDRDVSATFLGLRILFGQMSGSAICFKGYPTWTQLELAEIMCIVHKEDEEVVEESLEPMV